MSFWNGIGKLYKKYLYFRNKYLFQVFVIALGLVLVKVGITPDPKANLPQNALFLSGGLGVLGAGIISILYVAGVINKVLHNLFMYLFLPIGVFVFGYLDFRSINDEIKFRAMQKEIQREIKQRLRDIRDAQVEFKNKYGKYAADFAELKKFILTDKTITVKKIGDIPDKITQEMLDSLGLKEAPEKGLTEVQAWILSKKGVIKGFARDTTYQSVMELLFTNEKARATRSADSEYAFNIDSLDIVPFTGGKGKFQMKTDFLTKNNMQVPVFLVMELETINKDTLLVGSLTEASTSGNWGE